MGWKGLEGFGNDEASYGKSGVQMVKNLRAILKSLLINGESPVVDNPQQGESQLQRLSEETPKGEAIVRSMFITK